MTVLDQYFELSDRANGDEQAFSELVVLSKVKKYHKQNENINTKIDRCQSKSSEIISQDVHL